MGFNLMGNNAIDHLRKRNNYWSNRKGNGEEIGRCRRKETRYTRKGASEDK